MARFESRYNETLRCSAGPKAALDFLASPANRAAHTQELKRSEVVDADTLRFFLKPEKHGKVEFRGRYLMRWERKGDTVRWSTVPEVGSNITVNGQARVVADGGGSRIEWQEHVVSEVPINRLLAKAVGPVASRLMARGIRGAAESMVGAIRA